MTDIARRPRATRLFLGADVRVFTVAPDKLAIYDFDNDDAWLSAEQPVDLHNWR